MIHKNAPLVSIALCTYNGEKYLGQQLESIINQSYSNLEIIIVDDASTDNTLKILHSFQEKASNIKIFTNEYNIGFNQNFRKSLELCSAEFIAISDQDDIWELNKIEVLLDNIGDNLLIYHDSIYIDDNDRSLRKSVRTHHRFVEGFCAKNLIYNNCVSGHACLIRKQLFDLSGDLNQCFYYDWWLAYTAACTGRIKFITDKLVKYRLHADNSTKSDVADERLYRAMQINLFFNHPLTPVSLKPLLHKLQTEYLKLNNQRFSIILLWILIKESSSLFYVRKKSFFKLFSRIFSECKSISQKLMLSIFVLSIDNNTRYLLE